MDKTTLESKQAASQGKAPVPTPQTRLTHQEIALIRSVIRIKHGRALVRALVGFYVCESGRAGSECDHKKLMQLLDEFDKRERADIAKDLMLLIRDLTDRLGSDGLKKELGSIFGKRG